MMDAFLVGCRHRNCSLLASLFPTDRSVSLIENNHHGWGEKIQKKYIQRNESVFCCFLVLSVDITETWIMTLWQQRAFDMSQDWSKKIPCRGSFVVQLFSPNYKRRIKTPHKTWSNCSGFQNNRTNLKSCDLLMWRGWDVALGWGELRGVFTLNHPWCQVILYLTSPTNYRLLHEVQMVITLSGEWKSHGDVLWHPWFFALLGALLVY